MHDPREPHLTALKRILRYLWGTLDFGLLLRQTLDFGGRWGRERPRGRGGCCSPASCGDGFKRAHEVAAAAARARVAATARCRSLAAQGRWGSHAASYGRRPPSAGPRRGTAPVARMAAGLNKGSKPAPVATASRSGTNKEGEGAHGEQDSVAETRA
jgi:hypothetical protein